MQQTQHEQDIEMLRDEALRLIQQESHLLQKLLNAKGVIGEPKQNDTNTVDRESTQKRIDVLAGEATKLTHLEMVLAVVGTMKAGKSTTINAIVGMEVLPNRNRPMTALPTLIRHTPKQTEPHLRFDNHQPLNAHLKTLKQRIDQPENHQTVARLTQQTDMKTLVEWIKQGGEHKSSYTGSDAIFNFLRLLNDLVRFSTAINCEFPFQDYSNIHELPVIEVAFRHLNAKQTKGRLTLLDTPGPNESGQPALKKMLGDQLKKASAVLAILDYTQLKSEADAAVRQQLLLIENVAKGHIYTLVNKFDQKDRHSDNEDEVKSYVFNDLMVGKIAANSIFPVSSRWAYLANRARYALATQQQLPDAEQQGWVADFGKEAFGSRWQKKVDNVERVEEGIDDLWQDSLFQQPLEQVIHQAHQNAACYTIASAIAKLTDTADTMAAFLQHRETWLDTNRQTLDTQLATLKQNQQTISDNEQHAKTATDQLIQTFMQDIECTFDESKTAMFNQIERYFEQGSVFDSANYLKKRHTLKKQLENESEANGARKKDYISKKFNKDKPIISYEEQRYALLLVEQINEDLTHATAEHATLLQQTLNKLIQQFNDDFSATVFTQAKTITSAIESKDETKRFTISLTKPDTHHLSLPFNGNDMPNNLIHQTTVTEQKWRRSKGLWGSVCSLFNTNDWGWEAYELEKPCYEVDLHVIKTASLPLIENLFEALHTDITTTIKKPLHKHIEFFFYSFNEKIADIRQEMTQRITDYEKMRHSEAKTMTHIQRIQSELPEVLNATQALQALMVQTQRVDDAAINDSSANDLA